MKKLSVLLVLLATLLSCGGPDTKDQSNTDTKELSVVSNPEDQWATNKGIGPISELKLEDSVDSALVHLGEQVFIEKCSACHKETKRYIGPAPMGIFERRTPEWIMNMILNPDVMVMEDPIAKQLLMEYNGTPMANQNLSQDEARAVLEYFRTL